MANMNDAAERYEEMKARIDLAAAHRICVLEGLHEGSWTHLSCLNPGRPGGMLTSPIGLHWSQVTASSIDAVAADQSFLDREGTADPIVYHIHWPIHRDCPQAFSVMHAHCPYATALTLIEGGRLDERASQPAANFYGKIAYLDEYDGLVESAEQGERLAKALGDKRVLFLKNHGVIVVGPTIAIALTDLYTLERACMFQLLAQATGQPLSHIPIRVAEALSQLEAGNEPFHFEAMKRVLDAEYPEYRE